MTVRARHLPADARCRQLVRLINANPGVTVEELAAMAALSQRAARAYVVRLQREERIDVVLQEPASPRGCTKWLYPKGGAPAPAMKEAA